MSIRSLVPLATLACFATFGCSDGGSDEADGSESTPAELDWQLAVDGAWELDAGTEGYYCTRITIEEDTFFGGIRAIAPKGTHHTLLTLIDEPTEPDETFRCDANTVGLQMVYGSGVGTNELAFPPGVAVKLPAGSQLLLNLHLFNTSPEVLTGVSGTEIARVDPADVEHEAEIILAGKLRGLVVEPGVTWQTGRCEMSHDVNVFSVFPHMHQLGIHSRVTAVPAAGEPTVLVDAPYDFEDQLYYPVAPLLELAAGDDVRVECQYDNPGRDTVTFGDSSLEEMCFAGLYRYPKGDGFFICDSDGGVSPILDGAPCAEEGDTGNELGVGKYCTAGGGECTGDASVCLADYLSGDFANFCTTSCDTDADCGADAECMGSGTQSACFPTACPLPTSAGATQ